jgi:predicted  nucleic acid-binding Zn-ribbon protein
MKDVTRAKGLSDLRTAITTRVRAKPPQKETAYLELYLLSREKQRLEKELVDLEQRQGRIRERLSEIRQAMATLEQETEQERLSEGPSVDIGVGGKQPAPASQYSRRRWQKMPLDY